jgi:cytochrome c biogenesis protein CcmG, thiol:disulfide interchange protein DsbE
VCSNEPGRRFAVEKQHSRLVLAEGRALSRATRTVVDLGSATRSSLHRRSMLAGDGSVCNAGSMIRGRLLRAAALLVVALAVVIGIRQAAKPERPGRGPSSAETAGARDRAPAPLRALYAKGDALQHLQGDDFVAMVRRLRGYPVVINKWASWCRPCRQEFPMLRRMSAKYGDRIAFIGINAGDSNKPARAFLRNNPTLYPHVIDPSEQISGALRADRVFPSTIFLDRDANIVTVSPGPFPTETKLEQAIRRYALAKHPVRAVQTG